MEPVSKVQSSVSNQHHHQLPTEEQKGRTSIQRKNIFLITDIQQPVALGFPGPKDHVFFHKLAQSFSGPTQIFNISNIPWLTVKFQPTHYVNIFLGCFFVSKIALASFIMASSSFCKTEQKIDSMPVTIFIQLHHTTSQSFLPLPEKTQSIQSLLVEKLFHTFYLSCCRL